MTFGAAFRTFGVAVVLATGTAPARTQGTASSSVPAERPSGKPAGTVALPEFPKEAPYAEVRKSLLSSGWQPEISRKRATDDPNDYLETVSCAGTGEGNCLFRWLKGRISIEVSTIDDPPVIVAVRCRSGCRAKAR